MGLNLQVPLEIINKACRSSASAAAILHEWQPLKVFFTKYDGNPTWEWQIVAGNTGASAHDVKLYKSTDLVNPLATISVDAGIDTEAEMKLFKASFNAPAADEILMIETGANAADGNLTVYASRVVVTQTNATKTVIGIPLVNEFILPGNYAVNWGTGFVTLDSIPGDGYGQPVPNKYGVYPKDNQYFGGTIVTYRFWGLLGAALTGGLGDVDDYSQVALFNRTDNTEVASHTVSMDGVLGPSENREYFDEAIAKDATNFHDGDEMEVRLNANGSTVANLYTAHLFIEITSLDKAEVYHRVSMASAAQANNVYQRIILDPSKYTEDARFYLRSCYYQNGVSNTRVDHLRDCDGFDSSLTGAIPDAEVSVTTEVATKLLKTTEWFPPLVSRRYFSHSRRVSNWESIQLFIVARFPATLPTQRRQSTLEVPIELCDMKFVSSAAAATFLRSKVCINTNDYDGEVVYILEVNVAAQSVNNFCSLTLLDEADATIISFDMRRPGIKRVEFTPNVGTDYYRLKTGAQSGFTINARIIIKQRHTTGNQITKTRIYIPMSQALDTDFTASDTTQLYTIGAAAYTADNANKQTLFKRENVNLLDISSAATAIRFETVIRGTAGSTSYGVLWNKTDGVAVAASEVNDGGAAVNTYLKSEFAQDAADFHDGDTFEVRYKRGVAGNTYVLAARLSILISPFKETDVWWRIAYCDNTSHTVKSINSRVYLDRRAYNLNMTYFHEANGKADATHTNKRDVYSECYDALDGNTQITWNETVLTRKRTSGFDLPDDGYAYLGSQATVTMSGLGGAFIVLHPKKPSGRWPDFWPMFLGDIIDTM